MTTSQNNLYAEKVFAEHPLALWALDEDVSYVSMISEDQRLISSPTWTLINCQVNNSTADVPSPKLSTPINRLSIISEGTGTASAISPILSNQVFNSNRKTFSISGYIYTFNTELEVTLGYTYKNQLNEDVSDGITVPVAATLDWAFLSDSFDVPDYFTDLRVFISISYTGAQSGQSFILHGVTVGQWSEQFQVESLGVDLIQIPSDIAISGLGARANSYGLQAHTGYYISDNGSLTATNSNLPMVFGAEGSTKIIENQNGPSLIIPGFGFMSEDGQYKNLTFETWIKIQSNASVPQRIIGPIGSEDGVYVYDAFIALKVGDNIASYFISEWDRPMLLAISMSRNSAVMSINGEDVISLKYVTSDLTFPSKYNDQNKLQDFIGFYAYPDVPFYEIDAVGIYPYAVPSIVEKRRWVYGQAVEAPENISGSDTGSAVLVDYTVSDYAKNYIYPDIANWQQGITENLVIENNSVKIPGYKTPTFVFSENKTYDMWQKDISKIQDSTTPFIDLRPTSLWSDINGYILFENINTVYQDMKAFYGLFLLDSVNTEKQTLFYIDNELDKGSLEVFVKGQKIFYELKSLNVDGSMSTNLSFSEDIQDGEDSIVVGIDINKFSKTYGGEVAKFFGSKKKLKLYVGGSKKLINTFTGRIYRIGFCTSRNLQKISGIFNSSGTVVSSSDFDNLIPSINAGSNLTGSFAPNNESYWQDKFDAGDSYFGNSSTTFKDIISGGTVYSLLYDTILSHVASYTLVPKILLGKYIVDIAVNGYWQDYVPLSYFARYVTNEDGEQEYGLDFLQFNVGYPQVGRFLNNKYDTSNSVVKTYVSFQYLKNKTSTNPNFFSKTEQTPKSGVIEPGSDWLTTRYEVVNNTVIYLPYNIDFKTVSIVFHVEVVSHGISENPVQIKSMQISSQALNAFTPTAIGTKYGTKIYPYRKSGVYYDYKAKNPITIYKGSTPYLYMTSTSGIMQKQLQVPAERGVSVPINATVANFYKVSAWQMAIRYDEELFPLEATEIFEIESLDYHIKFYMIAEDASAKRARVYAVDAKTGLLINNVFFYVNGRLVKTPYLDLNTWSVLGITFDFALDFSRMVGALRFTGPIMFNNVFQYQSTAADDAKRFGYRRWLAVKGNNFPWKYWYDPEGTADLNYRWRDILFLSTDDFIGVDGKKIYKKYTGTDHIVIGGDSRLVIEKCKYSVYQDIRWKSSVVTPV